MHASMGAIPRQHGQRDGKGSCSGRTVPLVVILENRDAISARVPDADALPVHPDVERASGGADYHSPLGVAEAGVAPAPGAPPSRLMRAPRACKMRRNCATLTVPGSCSIALIRAPETPNMAPRSAWVRLFAFRSDRSRGASCVAECTRNKDAPSLGETTSRLRTIQPNG